ncbi:MAG: cytochrome c oxidase subunit II [Bacteroidota bacterium]
MDASSLLSIAQLLLVAIFAFVVVNLYLVFKLKDIDPFKNWNPDRINGNIMLLFIVVALPAAFISTYAWKDTFTLLMHPASEHGVEIDRMHINTIVVAVLVSVVTNVLLFYFAFRYSYKEDRKALYYPHNNRLEIIWTVVPAVVLTVLVFDGVNVWHDIWKELPEDMEVTNIEVNGKQFGWTVRYPGSDLEFGETSIGYINDATGNTLGFNKDDKRGYDDLVVNELYLPVNKMVHVDIKSRDVLHSMTLAHFRVKMDAVPGMPTYFNFKPTKTTAQMRDERKDPDFDYEMSCQQICGSAHWNMRLKVTVVEEAEYNEWLAKQTTFAKQYEELNGVSFAGTDVTPEAAEPKEETETQEEATEEVAMK